MLIVAKYPSVCPSCTRPISVGDRVDWERGSKARHAACASQGAPRSSGRSRKPAGGPGRAPSARKPRQAPPAGPEMRNDQGPYTVGELLVARLRESEIKECEERQGLTATEIPAADENAKPLRADERRVGCIVIHADRISQEWADDNGYCGRFGAIVRLATPEECASTIAARRAKVDRLAIERGLAAALDWKAPGVITVHDTGSLPPSGEIVARWTAPDKTVYALTATSIVAHHPGYYDDYRSSTRTLARTEELAAVIRALANNEPLVGLADLFREPIFAAEQTTSAA